jgi:hypothetical protein
LIKRWSGYGCSTASKDNDMGTYLWKDGEQIFVKKVKQVAKFLEAGYTPTNEPVVDDEAKVQEADARIIEANVKALAELREKAAEAGIKNASKKGFGKLTEELDALKN